MYRTIVFAVVLTLLTSSVAAPASRVSDALVPLASDQDLAASEPLRMACDDPPQVALPTGLVKPIADRRVSAPLQPTAVYSFTGSPIVTPTIDGVFSGQFVDGDGAASPGAGVKDPLAFLGLKLFDTADNVYWYDPSGSFTAWQPATMTLWLDGDDDGVFRTAPFTDAVIVGAIPLSGTVGRELDGLANGSPTSFLGHSPFLFNDVEFVYAAPSKANNRYDSGEDIYFAGQYFTFAGIPKYVDSVNEFHSAQHLLVADPDNPLGPPIAHVYWEQNADYVYFHNDFLVDGAAPFYDFNNLAGDDGLLDSDGTATANSGAPTRIGIDPAIRRWFTPTDQVMWYDADQDHHWTPGFDALWKDNGDGVYSSTSDLVVLYTGGVLTENLTATVVLNMATFEFVYSDDNGNLAWDSGEDIWALPGDETWDYNYFDNRIAWLIDGDGAATSGRGSDEPTRTDGDEWFDASDRVYFYDSNADNEWSEGADALWRDENGNGTYQAGTDAIIRADGAIPTDTTTSMILLQRVFVDGDGAATSGPGSANATRGRRTPVPFQPADLVYWHDGDRSKDWTISDTLWIDDGDGVFGTSITDTALISAAGFVSSTAGLLLAPGAHWIGYDDGEVNFNGRYDSGEDVWASNSYFAFDDLEIAPNWKYDLGEDIYDRDYLEIWVYAEGDNTDARMGGNEFAPDREPALRDVGFRVHLNGIRVDSTPPITSTRVISDYDAPNGIQAAAGWGPSRGFTGPRMIAPFDPAYGGLNRHYEYRIPRQGGIVGGVSAGLMPQRERESRQVIAILPDCRVLVKITWKDIKRRNSQGWFVSGTGNEYPTSDGAALVWEFFVHPLPPPPIPAPVKNDLNDPYWPGGTVAPLPPGEPPHVPADSFFDVFFTNPFETEIVAMQLTSNSPLGGQPRLLGAQASDPETQINPGVGSTLAGVMNLPPGAWVQLSVAQPVMTTASPGAVLTNTVNVTGTTPGGPMPPTGGGGDSMRFNPPITLTLNKTASVTTTTPGERITYTIAFENPGPLPLRAVKLTDTLPISFTPKSGWPGDEFDISFDVTYWIELPDMPVGGRGKVQIAGVVSPTVQPLYWLTNTVRMSFDTALSGTLHHTATNTVWVTGTTSVSVPPSGLTITGPTSVPINTPATFTLTVTPITATPPFTYVVQRTSQPPLVQTDTVPIELVSLSLTSIGPQVITATASNSASAVTATHAITVVAPVSNVTIDGPASGLVSATQTFTAGVSPVSATLPIQYAWQASGQSPVTHTSGLSDVIAFVWPLDLAGAQTITVTIANAGGTAGDTHAILIEPRKVYLPIVIRN